MTKAQNIHTVTLKPGRDKTARHRHPWIYSGAIARADKNIPVGEIVRVIDSKGNFVAYGYYNAASQIVLRLLEWDEKTTVDGNWWQDKLRGAIERREFLSGDTKTNCYRLVYSESDLLPGLIVDRYADYLVLQSLSAGIERVKDAIVRHLMDILHPAGIFERSETEIRKLERLRPSSGLLAGAAPPEKLTVMENGLQFELDIRSGQKSGLYLDQRENREIVASHADGRDLLDCFCYSGGFAIHALARNARSATLLDSSGPALAQAKANIGLNGIDEGRATFIESDVFKTLREFRAEGRRFDLVILDPPKFAPSKADLKKALSAYKDINMQALSILNPNGILATFSCSGAVDSQTLQTALFWAATDIGRQAQIIKVLSQAPDHPRLVTFPESEYLKGFLCRVF